MAAKVFLCYRRDDSAGYAGRVQDRLVQEFGRDLLFMDVDAIPLGVNFATTLRNEVAKCEVLLAVIGRTWLDARDEDGNRRLDDPHDFVRIEIGAALQRNIPVIPILLDGAKVPKANQLPKDLEELSLRNGLDVRHASFHNDLDRLVRGLKGQLAEADAEKRRAVEDELRRQEAENKRRLDEAEAEKRRRDEDDERRRQEKRQQAEARRVAEEERRRQEAENKRRLDEAEAEKRRQDEDERRRQEILQARAGWLEEERRTLQDATQRQRREEESRRLQEEGKRPAKEAQRRTQLEQGPLPKSWLLPLVGAGAASAVSDTRRPPEGAEHIDRPRTDFRTWLSRNRLFIFIGLVVAVIGVASLVWTATVTTRPQNALLPVPTDEFPYPKPALDAAKKIW
jgi:TIR domain